MPFLVAVQLVARGAEVRVHQEPGHGRQKIEMMAVIVKKKLLHSRRQLLGDHARDNVTIRFRQDFNLELGEAHLLERLKVIDDIELPTDLMK
jgi:hypothetical protein